MSGKGLLGQAPAGFAAERAAAALHLFDQRGVIGDARDDGDVFKVLGSGADHRGAADVDVFDQMAEGYAGLGGGFLKGVEVDHHHVDGLDAVGGDGGFVLLIAANIEQAAVDPGVQGLDAAIEHLREAGEFADVFDRESGLAQSTGGSAGGDQFDAKAGQRLGELHQARFVGNAEQRSADSLCRAHGWTTSAPFRFAAGCLVADKYQSPDYNVVLGGDSRSLNKFETNMRVIHEGFTTRLQGL